MNKTRRRKNRRSTKTSARINTLHRAGFREGWDFFGHGGTHLWWVESGKDFAMAVKGAMDANARFRIDARLRDCGFDAHVQVRKVNGWDGINGNMTGHVWISDGMNQLAGVAQLFELFTKGAIEEIVVEAFLD